MLFFILLSKTFPESQFFSRVGTWTSRIENFTTNKSEENNYQITKAKIAIASGKIYGLGPGKSVQKNFLPQSSSDFIYAIIVEEYGLIGGLGVLILYLLLFFRFVVAAHKANTMFGKLLVVGLGFPIIFQALINMCVAVELLPVTGQTLPLISSGGSSIWMTCAAIGIIISVTKKDEEIAQEQNEAAQRETVLRKLIDEQIEKENQMEKENTIGFNYSINDTSTNPLEPILKNKNEF
jgi:cell division protein FtsW